MLYLVTIRTRAFRDFFKSYEYSVPVFKGTLSADPNRDAKVQGQPVPVLGS